MIVINNFKTIYYKSIKPLIGKIITAKKNSETKILPKHNFKNKSKK